MPVYEYACTDCGEQLEVRQSFTDAALTVCPACSGRLRKVLSPVGVVFKGSGFYRNDSRAVSANGSGGDSGETAAGKDGKADDGKADKADRADKDGTGPKTGAPAASGSGSGSNKEPSSSRKPSGTSSKDSPSTAKANAG